MPKTRQSCDIPRKHDPLYLLSKSTRQVNYSVRPQPSQKLTSKQREQKVVLALDLGTAFSNLALLILPTSDTSPIPTPTDLLKPDTHIKILRGFGNNSGQWAGMPAGDVPSEIWFDRAGVRGTLVGSSMGVAGS